MRFALRETASGLAAAHKHGLIHRDVKPGNIWLEGQNQRVRILDFGLARIESDLLAADGVSLTGEGAVLGTPSYMSPEQGRGQGVDARTDIFSLGVILYQMTTGKLPFRGPNTMAILTALALDQPEKPRSLNPQISPALEAFILKLLEKNRETRPGRRGRSSPQARRH